MDPTLFRRFVDRRLLSRRSLVGTAGRSSLGAGLVAAGVTPAHVLAAVPPAVAPNAQLTCDDVQDLIVFAKYAKEARVQIVDCAECTCNNDLSLAIRYELTAELVSEPTCDEFGQVLPAQQQTILSANVTRHFRFVGPCQTPIGHHAGTFTIGQDGASLIFGDLRGTDGLSSDFATLGKECCFPQRDEGTMIGTDLGPPLSGIDCRFVATYGSVLEAAEKLADARCDPGALEEILRNWQVLIVGIVSCPCGKLR